MDRRTNLSRINADTIVIGAGPAGLGAALALGDSATVLESRETVGGLCGTPTLDGAIFDLGGHSFSTPHPDIRRLVFDALEMEDQKRDAWCWVNGEYVRYPFQQHFSCLANSDSRRACQIDREAAHGWQDAVNFDAYLDHRFGQDMEKSSKRWHEALPISGLASLSQVSTHEPQHCELRMAKQCPGDESFQHFLFRCCCG